MGGHRCHCKTKFGYCLNRGQTWQQEAAKKSYFCDICTQNGCPSQYATAQPAGGGSESAQTVQQDLESGQNPYYASAPVSQAATTTQVTTENASYTQDTQQINCCPCASPNYYAGCLALGKCEREQGTHGFCKTCYKSGCVDVPTTSAGLAMAITRVKDMARREADQANQQQSRPKSCECKESGYEECKITRKIRIGTKTITYCLTNLAISDRCETCFKAGCPTAKTKAPIVPEEVGKAEYCRCVNRFFYNCKNLNKAEGTRQCSTFGESDPMCEGSCWSCHLEGCPKERTHSTLGDAAILCVTAEDLQANPMSCICTIKTRKLGGDDKGKGQWVADAHFPGYHCQASMEGGCVGKRDFRKSLDEVRCRNCRKAGCDTLELFMHGANPEAGTQRGGSQAQAEEEAQFGDDHVWPAINPARLTQQTQEQPGPSGSEQPTPRMPMSFNGNPDLMEGYNEYKRQKGKRKK